MSADIEYKMYQKILVTLKYLQFSTSVAESEPRGRGAKIV